MSAGVFLTILLAGFACGRPPAQGPDAPRTGARGVVVFLPEGRSEARVQVELARSDEERQRGLMYRKQLEPDGGMLFIFEAEELQSFWMKDTLIPLDMIFIRSDLTVVGVVEAAEPLTLESRAVDGPSKYVVEVNGGWARAHGVAAGTQVRFEGVP